MKKNKMMRLASILLVVTLLSTSVISGTFAKYTTTANASDNARVAKWGIKMDVEGNDMFTATYIAHDQGNSVGPNSVQSFDGTDVVAPGTNSSSTYAVTGTPETDYMISFEGTRATSDVFIGQNFTYTYTDADDGNGTMTYAAPAERTNPATKDYYPITYLVQVFTNNGDFGGSATTIQEAKKFYAFDTLEKALEDLAKVTVTYDSGEGCDLKVTIAWEWKFDNATAYKNDVLSAPSYANSSTVVLTTPDDALDTVLGDIAASTGYLAPENDLNITRGSAGTDYSTTIEYTIQMTATQID